VMLSSRVKQFFFFLSDMPVLGLFNYREFLSTPESADSKNFFSGSKVFCFTNVESVRNFARVISERNVSRNSAKVQNYSNCLFEIKKISSAFRVQKCEPRSFAKCLQNLLIEKKSVERLWRFSKGFDLDKIGSVCREITF
jgi:hypothetical protein